MLQDSQGRRWFGSKDAGLFVLDGEALRRFTTADGLVDDAIRGLHEGRGGRLFVETPAGISAFDGQRFTTLEVRAGAPGGWRLEPDDLWFKGNGDLRDVYRYDGEALHELELPRQDLAGVLGIDEDAQRYNPYGVYGIGRDQAGGVWFGTLAAGAFRYDGADFLWVGEPELSELEDGRVPGVRAIVEDHQGHLWLSNRVSRYALLETGKGYEKLPGATDAGGESFPYFNSAAIDGEGALWTTSFDAGVWRTQGQASSFVPLDAPEGAEVRALSVYVDRDGLLWLGTLGGGLYTFDGQTFARFELGARAAPPHP